MYLEWFSILRLRLRALIARRRLDGDLEDELTFHLAARAEKTGIEEARRRFGNPTALKERCRDMWTFYWMEMLWQDLRFAGRTLRKSPGFTAVAALTLALGIGANTAIFSVANVVILRPLPYPEPSRLVALFGNVKRAHVERRGTSIADYLDWRAQSRSFEDMALYMGDSLTLTGSDEPERVPVEYVAQAYFQLLGINAALGRTFRPEEDQEPQRDAVVVIGDGLWKRRFGADPNIIGRSIQLNRRAFIVVGVMPPWFRGAEDAAELWAPLMMSLSPQDLADRGSRGPTVLARLKHRVSISQAQSEMDAICKGLERAYPGTNEGRGVELSLMEQEIFVDIRKPLVILLAAVGMVLLIACTNVANLLLARFEARQREIAMRIALGAGRARMLHQLTTESLALVLTGGAAGLVFARLGVRVLIAASPVTFPGYVHPEIDWRVALFTLAISCLAGLALGLAPAAQVRSSSLSDVFKQASSHSADSRGGRGFRNVLVVAEVAFAMILLVGAGLLIRSLQQLAAIQPGYDPSHILALRVALPRIAPPPQPGASAPVQAAPPDARTVVTARDILRQVAQIPSVEIVAAGSDVPMAGGGAIFYTAEGQPPVTAQNVPRTYVHRVSQGFFQALRIHFVAGRTFSEQELQGNSNVVIVSENVVKRFWPGQDPIGKRIKAGGINNNSPWMSIVGVVNEMKYRGLPNNPTNDPDVFVPFAEQARGFALLLRTPVDPASLANSVRKVLRDADPTAVVYSVSTMEQMMAQQLARSRFTGWLMGIFAAAALLLAMTGIYGVMSYAVSRRTPEIGIRVALGAAHSDVLKMIVGRGMGLVAIGLVLGVTGAMAVTRLIGTLLYGVTPTDLLSFAAAAVVLAGVAFLACLIPASRACRIHPAIALRNE